MNIAEASIKRPIQILLWNWKISIGISLTIPTILLIMSLANIKSDIIGISNHNSLADLLEFLYSTALTILFFTIFISLVLGIFTGLVIGSFRVERTWHGFIINLLALFFSSLKFTSIISVFILGYDTYKVGLDKTIANVQADWQMFPIAILIFMLFNLLFRAKTTVHKAGFDLSEKALAENYVAEEYNEMNGGSPEKYAQLIADSSYSKNDVQTILEESAVNASKLISASKQLIESKQIIIPAYIYRKGLPGSHLFKNRREELFTTIKVEEREFSFYATHKNTDENSVVHGKKLASIPINSILGIEVSEKAEGRVLRKSAGYLAEKGINRLTKVMSDGIAERTKFFVESAELKIQYLSPDGAVCTAEFFTPSESKMGKQTKTILLKLAKICKNLNLFDQYFEVLPMIANSLDEVELESIELDKVEQDNPDEALLGMTSSLYSAAESTQWLKILTDDDQGYSLTVTSAEMLKAFCNEGVTLTKYPDENDKIIEN